MTAAGAASIRCATLALLAACASATTPTVPPDDVTGSGGQPEPARPRTAGAGGTVVGTAGAGGSDAAAGFEVAPDASVDASTNHQPVDASGSEGPRSSAGCATYPVCSDFEGPLPATWRGVGTSVKVASGKAAHGTGALHLSNLQPGASRVITTTQLGSISNVMWGRFYLHITPGAPNGHGSMVSATDQAGNWYELGFQFSAYHGNWHVPAGVPERWMNSKVTIPPDRWICVEFLFDGASAAATRIWSDGVEVKYSQTATSPPIAKVIQFKKFEIGFRAIHGTSIKSYEGSAAPATSDVWIDDLALAASRVGCVTP